MKTLAKGQGRHEGILLNKEDGEKLVENHQNFTTSIGDVFMLSPDQVERIKDLRDQGYSISKISKAVDVDRNSVKKYLMKDDDDMVNGEIPPQNIQTQNIQRRRTRNSRPLVSNPSPELKTKRELAEAVDLEVDIQEKLKELKGIRGTESDLAVAEKEAEVRVDELAVRGFKAKRELEVLTSDIRQREAMQIRRGRLEKAKLAVLPGWLLGELSPALALKVSTSVTTELLKLDAGLDLLSDSEIESYAKLAMNSVFGSPEYYQEARVSIPRAVRIRLLQVQDEALHVLFEAYKQAKIEIAERTLPGEGFSVQVIEEVKGRISGMSYDKFLEEANTWLLNNNPQLFSELVSSLVSFNQSMGNHEANKKLAEIFQA